MPRVFPPHADTILRAALGGVMVLAAGGAWAAWAVQRSPYVTRQNVVVEQPVPFSHLHHVSDLGLDCRFCHATAEKSSFAGMPTTKVCISCHAQVWTNAAVLAPVRESWKNGTPISWNRVHNLPKYVYFDHSAHVNKGVGCTTCHGPVGEMPMTYQAQPMTMQWCLSCHRHPEAFLRPKGEVYNPNYAMPPEQPTLGASLKAEYHVRSEAAMTECNTCHR